MNTFVFLFVIAVCSTCTSSLNVESRNRIAGGSAATDANRFRYMISLQEKSQLNTLHRGHRCGGALVAARHAVTAASCLYDNVNGTRTLLNADDYRVFAGALDLTNDASADHHRDVERFTVHPDYNPGTPYVNDIAVITLKSVFSTNIIQVATLAEANSLPTSSPEDYMCTSSGWGSQNDTDLASTQLMQVSKMTYDNIACQVYYNDPTVAAVTLQNTMMCALPTAVVASSCRGDLGNPLVCGSNFHGILIHTGNSNCSAEVLVPRPEIYTRISSFRTWIQTTAGASTFQPGIAVLAVIAIVQIITTL